MTILVINSGSSSIKAALFNDQSLVRLLDARVNDIGGSNPQLCVGKESSDASAETHAQALTLIFAALSHCGYNLFDITAVGHRVLHGGEALVEPTIVSTEVEQVIESMNKLAPLHNPACLAGIRAARKVLEHCPHIAVFDTGFHSTLPAHVKHYALPNEVTSTYHLRRFGFHGISHDYVSRATASALNKSIKQLRIISCHLGNGCSVTAIEGGRSVETSMGMTPLEGLVMGTRSGDLDPGIVIQLLRDCVDTADELDTLLNRKSGLFGMTGTNDMREIEVRAANGDENCLLAIQVFTHSARKYVGAYAAVMGGVDVIVFTGGIGEHSVLIRHRIAQQFNYLGASLDEDRNRDARVTAASPVIDIATSTSKVRIVVVATDEEAAIANSVNRLLGQYQLT
ncbi:acetate/propionate family kinase [Paraglaciecola arctica]|uniref:Acetate kinase n=1 Tax=Paraglaciecola arctica BSs20135 TaxID=493475 RepID=K6XNQ7_9ALTE|nr:acetate/propionate family kinase [Paraglaciecola arctica]GAC22279.1 acetate kinase [Paraglaciecola arctica BSs20135]